MVSQSDRGTLGRIRRGHRGPGASRTMIDRLRSNRRLRRLWHAAHVAAAVHERSAFLRDVLTGRAEGTYRSRRTGQVVTLRPRSDLQVAREQLSLRGYLPPRAVSATLGGFRPMRVLDLGANIGLFALSCVARDPDVRVVAVEPDPANAALLRRNVARNALGDAIEVVAAAAGTGPGRIRFAADMQELSHALPADAAEGIEVEMLDVFALAAGHDFVKIDIEGGEWPILRDPRLATLEARVIVLEWHERGAEVATPRAEVERLLRAAGYEVVHQGREVAWAGELWAYRA
jgi:FkbM family methyltransferase